MKLNHLTLAVTDVAQGHAFLEKYFGLRSMGAGNERMAGLVDDDGMTIVLTNLRGDADVRYPYGFHIGFLQKTRERVDEIYRRLKEDGYDVPAPQPLHGSWAFFCAAPAGFHVEVGGPLA